MPPDLSTRLPEWSALSPGLGVLPLLEQGHLENMFLLRLRDDGCHRHDVVWPSRGRLDGLVGGTRHLLLKIAMELFHTC